MRAALFIKLVRNALQVLPWFIPNHMPNRVLPPGTACYLLLPAAPPETFCQLVLPPLTCCCLLLSPATSYSMHLPSSTHCYLLQPPAIVTIHAIHLLPSTLSPGIVSRWQRLKIKRCRITKQAAGCTTRIVGKRAEQPKI